MVILNENRHEKSDKEEKWTNSVKKRLHVHFESMKRNIKKDKLY